MVLKRKRSSSELCSSPSASSTCSSAFSFSSPPNATQAPIFWDTRASRNLFAAPAHLSSRTMKRFRDGRPSEEMIHQRTLNLLFSAQHQQPHESPASAPSEPEREPPASTSTVQHSLHRFWAISSAPKPPTTSLAPSYTTQQSSSSSCEDCGAAVEGSGVDMDGSGCGSGGCVACGKQVCFSCSVSNLGEQRRCLQCAGRRDGTSDDMMMG